VTFEQALPAHAESFLDLDPLALENELAILHALRLQAENCKANTKPNPRPI